MHNYSRLCLTEFVKTTNTHAAGAVKHPTVSTVDDCKRTCIKKDGCAGFDFIINECWLHNSVSIKKVFPGNGVDLYRGTVSCKIKLGVY